jgi:hypothetical protein
MVPGAARLWKSYTVAAAFISKSYARSDILLRMMVRRLGSLLDPQAINLPRWPFALVAFGGLLHPNYALLHPERFQDGGTMVALTEIILAFGLTSALLIVLLRMLLHYRHLEAIGHHRHPLASGYPISRNALRFLDRSGG